MSVKVIAHRGACVVAPQNTMPAFEKGLELNVDGFETDVHLTADGIPVLCHDYEIEETSNGHGTITSMNLDELLQFDIIDYHVVEGALKERYLIAKGVSPGDSE